MVGHLSFESRIVAFIDILGFGSLVEVAARNPDGPESQRLSSALAIISNLELHAPDRIVGKSDENPLHQADFRLQIFSDSVILSIKPQVEGLKNLLHHLSRAFILLMNEGIYIRGGIAHGDVSTRSTSPCGPAVNAAYRIESNIADWPRIVLNRSSVRYCRTNCPELLESSMIERHDEDGVFQLSPIRYAIESQKEFEWPIGEMAPKICDHLNNTLETIVDEPRVYRKIAALAEHWNFFVDPKKSGLDGNFRTNGYFDPVETFQKALEGSPAVTAGKSEW